MLKESEWKNGFSVPVTLNGMVPVVENGWQVQMTFTDGSEQVWENVVLEDGDTITFTLENGTLRDTHACRRYDRKAQKMCWMTAMYRTSWMMHLCRMIP
ncbi:MAG: hypothetical protein V8Q36_04855 [Anaerotignum sp.]